MRQPVVAVHLDAGNHVEEVVDDTAATVEEPDPHGHRRDDGHRPGQQEGDLQNEARGLRDHVHEQREQGADRHGDEGGHEAEDQRAGDDGPELAVRRQLDVVLESYERRRLAELLGEPVLLQGRDRLPDEWVPEAEHQDGNRGDEKEVRGTTLAATVNARCNDDAGNRHGSLSSLKALDGTGVKRGACWAAHVRRRRPAGVLLVLSR